MFEISEKFVKNLEKADQYYVLGREKDYLIIGTTIKIKEHQENENSVFQIRSQNIEKNINIFFLLTVSRQPLKIEKDFKKKKFPVLFLNSKQLASSANNLHKILEEFILNNFRKWDTN